MACAPAVVGNDGKWRQRFDDAFGSMDSAYDRKAEGTNKKSLVKMHSESPTREPFEFANRKTPPSLCHNTS